VRLASLKYWIRSGSFEFMLNQNRRGPVASLAWNQKPLFYRPGTSDLTLIYRVLLKPAHKREYLLPELQPKTVLDIGANIGVTSVLMAQKYPEAQIYAFEPVPENFELLERNTAGYSNIHCFAFALGDRDAELSIRASDDPANFGGFSFFEAGTDTQKKSNVQLRHVNHVLKELRLESVDLIKIDTEGAEHSILTTLDPAILEKVQWITGELHGNQDFALLNYLSDRFDIAIHKGLRSRLSVFEAALKPL
jgi:FkbM family methyltransferase